MLVWFLFVFWGEYVRILALCPKCEFCPSLKHYISHGNSTIHKSCITEVALSLLNWKSVFKTNKELAKLSCYRRVWQ